jgi:hypothetical protein
MLVAETEYKHQVEADIRPFHDVLLGLFFITIGMKLDWHPVWDLAAGADAHHPAGADQGGAGGRAGPLFRAAPAWPCAPACTWPRPASSASCC